MDFLLRGSADDAWGQIGSDGQLTLLRDAFDLGWPRAEADIGDDVERDRAAGGGLYRNVLDRRQALARILVERDADRDLAIGQREFGAVLIDVAQRGQPDRVGHGRGGHAQARRQVHMRRDDDFGTLQIAADARRDQTRQAGHLFDQFAPGFGQQFGIVTAQRDGERPSAAAPATVRAEGNACVGDLLQFGRERAFELIALHFAFFFRLEDRADATVADKRAGIDRIDPRLFLQEGRDASHHRLRFGEGGTRHHLDQRGAAVTVAQRLEGRWEHREQEDGCAERGRTGDHRRPAVEQGPFQNADIRIHDEAFAVRGFAMRLQEIGGEHRRDEARDGEAHQHRGDDRQAEILEELPRNARHQADRQEYRDDRHSGSEHGQADFVGSVDRGLIGRFAHAHVAHDVLNLHDRIVDQHARDQAQRHQRHVVEREAHQLHDPKGWDRGQGNGERGDDGRAPIAQEDQHDHHRQRGPLDHRFHRGVILRLGVFHAVGDALEMDLGVALLERGQFLFGFGEDGDVRGVLGALEVEAQHLFAVELRR
ncbi:hypothetical protein D9M73_113920 [compost metagenome]